jgi:hypothetical protein
LNPLSAQRRAEALFGREVASLQPDAIEFRAPADDAMAAALAQTRCADLTALGRPGGQNDRGFARRIAEQMLLGSGGPVLFVPHATAVAIPGSNVLVAWDGGREAARAVRDALPLLATAQHVTVFTATDEQAPDAIKRLRSRAGTRVRSGRSDPEDARSDDTPCAHDPLKPLRGRALRPATRCGQISRAAT